MRDLGTLTFPASLRERYGLRKGDSLTLIDLDGVFVLSPKVGIVGKLAREIEYMRRESGVSLDDLYTSVQEERTRYNAEHGDLIDQDGS